MPLGTKTFRLFVSSTFSDLKKERNALQRHVFPKLRDLCMQHGYRFQAIDLRWGVREQAALDQQTTKICLEEIARCRRTTPRPNFIVLLGDRYGWQPLPSEIPATEFTAIEQRVSDRAQHALLSKWYRRDDNAILPVYCLQPRRVTAGAHATAQHKEQARDAEQKEWQRTEHTLRTILRCAISGLPLTDSQRARYTSSATEQEIAAGALTVPDAQEHVFAFFRTIGHLPQDARAEGFIDLVPKHSTNGTTSRQEGTVLDSDARRALAGLKERLRRQLGAANIFTYDAAWTGNGITTDHLRGLCHDVYRVLSRTIEDEISPQEEISPLRREIDAHDSFCTARASVFVGRAGTLRTIRDYIRGDEMAPRAIVGVSGTGKSALVARAAAQARDEYLDTHVIARFIGATAASADLRSLLRSLCGEISDVFHFRQQEQRRLAEAEGDDQQARRKRAEIVQEYAIPEDIKRLLATFSTFLAKVPGAQRLIIFLDALDQLSDAAHAASFTWLPLRLPDNVRLIVSTSAEGCRPSLTQTFPEDRLIELETMPAEQAERLLGIWLKNAGRTLQPGQRQGILASFARNGLPLYLRLAFEEARRWKSYTRATKLSPDIQGIIGDLFARLSLDAHHGAMMVSRSLGYLAASRHGLTEDELMDLLSGDAELFADFTTRAHHQPPEQRLPVVVWSRLYFDLEPYLTERSADDTSLMSFYHRQLREVAHQVYLSADDAQLRHQKLAEYFGGQLLHIEGGHHTRPNRRKLSELPYQQTCAAMWKDLETTLTDLRFIEAKCAAGTTHDLIRDYAAALAVLPEAQKRRQQERDRERQVADYTDGLIAYAKGESDHLDVIPSIEPWSSEKIRTDAKRIIGNPTRLDRLSQFSRFVHADRHVFTKHASTPGFVLQQAHNAANSGPVTSAAAAIIQAGAPETLVLRAPSQRPAYTPHPALITSLETDPDEIKSISISADAKRAIAGGKRVRFTSREQFVRVWDLESGECLHTLAGHTAAVGSVSMTPDGRLGVSGSAARSKEGTQLRLWDLASGACLEVLEGHHVSITPDGGTAVSADAKNLRLWDLKTGECLRTLAGHTREITALCITPDGTLAISGSAATLHVWHLATGESLRALTGHSHRITSVCITPDAKTALSGSTDQTLRVWDVASGRCLRVLKGHPGVVLCVSMTPDGKTAVSGGGFMITIGRRGSLQTIDNTLRVWDLVRGECRRIFAGHLGDITSVSLSPDGTTVVSGSDDKTIRVWDLTHGECRGMPSRHSPKIWSVSLTPDGQRAVSAGQDTTPRLWDLARGRARRTFKGHTQVVTRICATPDGNRAVSVGGHDKTFRVWDLASGKCRAILAGHTGQAKSVCITPDSTIAVTSGGFKDNILRVWTLADGRCLRKLRGHTAEVSSMLITPDGSHALSAAHLRDNSVRVWDIARGSCRRHLRGHSHSVECLAITPDGRTVLTGSRDRTLRVWDVGTGRCHRVLKGHGDIVNGVAITGDGRRGISTGGHDGTLRVWNLQTGECRGILKGHTAVIATVRVTLDGRMVVSRAEATSFSSDHTMRVWDIASGKCQAIYQPTDRVSALSQARPDGQFACGTERGEVVRLVLHNASLLPPIVTPLRIRMYGKGRRGSRWDDAIRAACPWCGQRFLVPDHVVDVTMGIARDAQLSLDHSPCLALPDEAWDEPRLLSECAICHEPVRFNPFVVDRRPRASRWRFWR